MVRRIKKLDPAVVRWVLPFKITAKLPAGRDVIELEGTEPNADALTVVTVDANQVVQPNGSALDNSGQDGVQVSSTDVIVLEDTEPKCWHTDYHRDRCESTYQPSWFTQCRQGSKCWHTDF